MRTLMAAALLCAAAVQTGSAQQAEAEEPIVRRTRGDGVHIRIARNYHLPANQVATRPVIVLGGAATIDGRMEDDLIVIGGPLRINSTAQIHANVVSVGGEVILSDGAQVTGEIQDVSIIWTELRCVLRDWLWDVDRGWWSVVSLVGTILRLTLVMVAACFIALVAPQWTRRIERTVTTSPFASGVVGLMMQVMFVPLLVVAVIGLIITVIGIPLLVLLPFALLAFMIMWLAGFAGVAAQLGGRLRGSQGASDSALIDTACGVALLGLVSIIGNLLALGPFFFGPAAAAFSLAGIVIEYIAWTVGLGAVLRAPFRNQWHTSPPAVPAHASATLVG